MAWGYWDLGAGYGEPHDIKAALSKIFTGEAGTKAWLSWPAGRMQNVATFERLPNEVVTVASQSYDCIVIHLTDSFGTDIKTWTDSKTGIPLHAIRTGSSRYDWHATSISLSP
jgi:hypothetical protein